MSTGVYTGYGLRVRTEGHVIVDDRINLHAPILSTNIDMNIYQHWLTENNLSHVTAGHGHANQFIRLFPTNLAQTESLLVILPPVNGKFGSRHNPVINTDAAHEDSVNIRMLAQAPFGFPTKRYILTTNGFHKIGETVLQNILARYHNSGAKGREEVTAFSKNFGFTDGQHMIDSIRMSVAPEIFHFLDWTKLFKDELTIANFEPMVVTVKKAKAAFVATA